MPFVSLANAVSRLAAGVVVLLLLSTPSLADEALPVAPADEAPIDWLDAPRDFLSQHLVSLSTRMDSFFADERVFEESRRSYVRLYGDLSYKEAKASDVAVKIQAKLVLPALEKRLKLLIESDDQSLDNGGVSSITTPKGVPNVDVPQDFRAAVQLQVTDSPHWNINTDAGLRIHSFSLDAFVRARARRLQNVHLWQLRFTQSVYWFEQSGGGASVQYDADRKLSTDYLGRSRTVATWSDHDQQFSFEQSFFLFQSIDQRNAMSYQLGVFGASRPNSHVTDYAIGIKWRHRLHRQWLFGEIQPLLTWPEDQGFRPTTSILFRLEAVFGDVGCGCYGL